MVMLCLLIIAAAAFCWLLTSDFELKTCLAVLPCLLLIVPIYTIFGLYPSALISPQEELYKLTCGTSVLFLIIAAITFFFSFTHEYFRLTLLLAWFLALICMPIWRAFLKKHFAVRPWWGHQVIVCGCAYWVKKFIRHLLRNPSIGLKPGAVVLLDDQEPSAKNGNFVFSLQEPGSGDSRDFPPGQLCSLPCYDIRHLPTYAENFNSTYAVMLLHTLDLSARTSMAALARQFRKTFFVFPFLGHLNYWSGISDLAGTLALETRQKLLDPRRQRLKRMIDLLLTLLGCTVFIPLTLFFAVLIKIEDGGPVFYSHSRIGKGGKQIKILKFRTMIQNADKVLEDYLAADPSLAEEWAQTHKLKNDPRITRVGKWLRRTSLDELPQVWNVLRGDLSFVGPRPIVEEEIAKYGHKGYELYTQVIPGLTGYWQISGRSNTSYAKRVELDSYYIRNWSVWLDIYIIACTPKTILNISAAY